MEGDIVNANCIRDRVIVFSATNYALPANDVLAVSAEDRFRRTGTAFELGVPESGSYKCNGTSGLVSG